jgi:hypothetical protein
VASKTSKTRKGVRLTLGGAPEVWHQVPGVGLVHPKIVRPISDSEVEFVNGADCLEVVSLTDTQADKAAQVYDDARAESAGAVSAAKAASPIEADQINDEAEAATKELD